MKVKVLLPDVKDLQQFTDKSQPELANRTLHKWEVRELERTNLVNSALLGGYLKEATPEVIAQFEAKYEGRADAHLFKYKEVSGYTNQPFDASAKKVEVAAAASEDATETQSTDSPKKGK